MTMFQIDPDMTTRELEPIADLADWDTSTVERHLQFYRHQAQFNPLWEKRVAEMRTELDRRVTVWANAHA